MNKKNFLAYFVEKLSRTKKQMQMEKGKIRREESHGTMDSVLCSLARRTGFDSSNIQMLEHKAV